ncbi:BON domain-containing protein [Paraburkholderia silviterrae]|uniref:BON domain-containing protein n=1 Tax=Paraburkholderia silviterrae TaxID=2528715 RepID=A0A4R5M9Z8_9BURK|nr:BON domain-containing protein [Paraburkholderia silviterrae]TDG23375.1 BON domain-containing protein [Paraburkholderia silviterrae]
MSHRIGIRIAAMALLMSACASALAQGGKPTASSQTAAAPPAASSPAPTDHQLAAAVRHALHATRKRGLKSTFIRVHARDGAITLTGVVADQDQIALAISVAQGVQGVRTIASKLEVRSDGEMKGSQ